MEGTIDLTLQSIQGVGWRPCGTYGGSDAVPLSRIKAHVSFSGSAPNMKVSSFAMCPDKGKLVVESNTHEIVEISERETEINPHKTQLLNTTFTDPFEEKRLHQRLSSNNSSSSNTSSSSYRPHLQFDLRKGNCVEVGEVNNWNPGATTDASDTGPTPNPQHDRLIKLHISFRSVEGDAIDICSEGVADLRLPEINFESFPLILDLPITPSTSINSTDIPQVFFESSAYIRVHLDDATKRQHDLATHTTASQEYVLSDHVDEIELVGMVRKIHEYEEMTKIRDDAAKPNLFGAGHKGVVRRRFWALQCDGTMDIKHSIQAFFDEMRGMRTKCVDPDQELFTNVTMTSTIVTRDSLEM